jgi:hypothetical protein
MNSAISSSLITIFERWFFPIWYPYQASAAVTVTGMPLRAPFPDGSSMKFGGDNTFVLTPGALFATAILVPGLPWPHPCGIVTTPGLIARR